MKFLKKWDVVTPQFYGKNIKPLFIYSVGHITSKAIPHVLLQYNIYIWESANIISILQKNKYWKNNSCTILQKLINLNTKCGFKLKTFNLFAAILQYIYTFFIKFKEDINTDYPSYRIFWEFSSMFPDEFYKPDFLFNYIYMYAELIFLIKRVKPKKKKKKKLTVKSIVSYIPKRSRFDIVIRLISTYINSSPTRQNVIRLGDAILYLIFAGKNSFLYKKKLIMYGKIIEKKKFY